MLFVMLLGLMLTGPAAVQTPVHSAAVQPVLLELAAAQPDELLRIIVQKMVDDQQVEQLVQSLGGEILSDLSIIHAFAANLPASAIHELAASPAVRWISLDAQVVSTAAKAKKSDSTNYYLDTLGHTALLKQNKDLTGTGIGVAVVDSGVSKVNDLPNLIKVSSFNPNAKSPNDTYGHGTHVAGIIAGNGPSGGGAYKGIAPGVNLIGLKISDDMGMAYESDTVAALQWILNNREAYNIRVVNLSINSTVESSYHQSALNAAVEILWFNGIVVVASSGNKGAGSSNTANAAPANDPFIITVGATDEKNTSSRSDDVTANYTAYGITTDGHRKPEVLAPGSNIFSLLSNQSDWG